MHDCFPTRRNPSSSSSLPFLLPLALVGFVDAIGLMIVGPSILFYVHRFGGTLTQYGWALSAFSLTSFGTKPLLGMWSDRYQTYRQPFIVSLLVASLGGLLYMLASTFEQNEDIVDSTNDLHQDRDFRDSTSMTQSSFELSFTATMEPSTFALTFVFLGRVLGGVGAANAGLVFAYAAKVSPSEQLTRANTVLSMARILGMAVGPLFNVLLSDVNVTIASSSAWKLDPLNSVGFVLFFSNLLSAGVIFVWLKEPSDLILQVGNNNMATKGHDHESDDKVSGDDAVADERKLPPHRLSCWSLWSDALFDPGITIPAMCNLAMCANYHLIATALPPASNHALGWGPVEVSTLLGPILSACVVLNMTIVYALSSLAIRDHVLLLFGLTVGTVGFLLVYFLWKTSEANENNEGTQSWHFYLSVLLSLGINPYVAPTSQSIFSNSIKESLSSLSEYQGMMQSILSMGGSIAGFVCPSIVATYCLRNNDSKSTHHELSIWSLYPVFFYVLSIMGVSYLTCFHSTTTTTMSRLSHSTSDNDLVARATTTTKDQNGLACDRFVVSHRRKLTNTKTICIENGEIGSLATTKEEEVAPLL